jgi:hypothetical protein
VDGDSFGAAGFEHIATNLVHTWLHDNSKPNTRQVIGADCMSVAI